MRNKIRAALIAATVLAMPQAVWSHNHVTGVVKERMEVMERFEELMERMFAMVHGELPYSPDVVRNAAKEIKEGAGVELVALFPKGSNDENSEASAGIWRRPRAFAHNADVLQTMAAQLEAVTEPPRNPASLPKKWEDVPAGMMGGGGMMRRDRSGEPLETALWSVAQTCNACHARFRVEKADHN